MDQVTIAIKALHGRIDETKEEISSMENGFVHLENAQRKLQNAIEAVVDNNMDTKTQAENAEVLAQHCLRSAQSITESMNTMDVKFVRLLHTLYVVLAFCVGGVVVPLLHTLIVKLGTP